MAKLMLVEDDNNLREIYQARLQAEGYDIVSAKDGEEALVTAKAQQPDLIISDVMMPKISGFEMLDILRNTDGLKDVKIIMLTALGQSDDQERADKLGADRYLVKSQVTLEDIVKTAHDLLNDAPAEEPATPVADPAPVAPAPVAPPVEPAPVAVAPEPVAVVAEPAPVVEVAVEPAPVAPTPPAPVAAAPAPAPTPVVDTPVAPVAPAPVEPTPVAVATPVTPAPAPVVDANTQSTAQEEASVEAKIEDFVAGASSEPTPATPAPVVDTPVAPVAPAPVEPAAPSPTDIANDDKLMSDAVDTLIASAAPTPAATPVQPLTVAPLSEAAAPAPAPAALADPNAPAVVNDSTPIAGKKVITPMPSDGKQDINTLLALEEAKEAAAAPPPPPNAIVSTNEEGAKVTPLAVSLPASQPAEDAAATVAPTNSEDTPSGGVVSNPGGVATTPVDPNSIAL